jgi:hypothetical protein
VGRAARAEQGAQRGERVVGEQARPDEVPDGGGQDGVVGEAGAARADPVGEPAEEQRLPSLQDLEHRLVHRCAGLLERRRQQQVGGVGELQGHPAVVARQ